MSYYSNNWYTIILKHYILLILYILKFLFILCISWVFFYIWYNYEIDNFIKIYMVFWSWFVTLIYAFLKLISLLVEYYNSVYIIKWDYIYIINSSLFIRDSIEIIHILKIIETDSFSNWLFANLLWIWTIKIELQTKEELFFNFIPHRYKFLNKLKHQRERLVEEKKKKYIITEEIN